MDRDPLQTKIKYGVPIPHLIICPVRNNSPVFHLFPTYPIDVVRPVHPLGL